jgi:hypothetical protein
MKQFLPFLPFLAIFLTMCNSEKEPKELGPITFFGMRMGDCQATCIKNIKDSTKYLAVESGEYEVFYYNLTNSIVGFMELKFVSDSDPASKNNEIPSFKNLIKCEKILSYLKIDFTRKSSIDTSYYEVGQDVLPFYITKDRYDSLSTLNPIQFSLSGEEKEPSIKYRDGYSGVDRRIDLEFQIPRSDFKTISELFTKKYGRPTYIYFDGSRHEEAENRQFILLPDKTEITHRWIIGNTEFDLIIDKGNNICVQYRFIYELNQVVHEMDRQDYQGYFQDHRSFILPR